jgi:hypothetical protein
MSAFAGAALRAGRAGRGLLPTGQLLTSEVRARRHRGIVWLLWLHVAGIAVFALARGETLGRGVGGGGVRAGRRPSGGGSADPLGGGRSA